MSEICTQNALELDPSLTGTLLLVVQFDVCEEIQIDPLAQALGIPTVSQSGLRPSAPVYGRYERPPLVEPFEDVLFPGEGKLSGEVKYYDYGVLSVLIHLPFRGDWSSLIRQTAHWMWEVDLAAHAERIVHEKVARATTCMIKPYKRYLSEEYVIFHTRNVSGVRNAAQMLSQHGPRIAQVVRGDSGELSEGEITEVLRSQISYYASDLAVVGWNAAFLYDTTADAKDAVQLLEYANSQLLELRYYDELLTQELAGVYKQLERKTGTLARWRLAGSATRLQTTLLEVSELTERVDNAIKFLSDMFAARLYRLAATRVGVADYRNIVTAKVHVAEDLYRYMVDQFNQSRAFLLELTVVIILVVELIFLFRGKGF